MKAGALLDTVIDRLAPPSLNHDLHERKRVQLFLLSHLFGPILGLPIPLYLFLVDPQPYPHVHIMAVSVLFFWAFPALVRVWPRYYVTLAFFSILNLEFAVLYGAYHYGGASSPFLLWFILIPLLAFFYLGGSVRAQILVFAQIFAGLTIFSVAAASSRIGFPEHVPIEAMTVPGLLSAFCSTAYAFFMASYYSRVVDNQSELIKEVARHEKTLAMLTVAKEEAEHAMTLAEARNTELEQAKSRLEHTALHDWLTGLPNRRYIDQMLVQQAARCAASDGSIALLHIDLDRFKQINDTLGHTAGDAMLVHVARILGRLVTSDDFVARIGGDEFLIVRTTDVERGSLIELADAIIEEISRPVPYMNNLCRFGCCIGIAAESGEAISPQSLMVNSDTALYRAKSRGRNKAEFFTEELQAQLIQTNRIADDILRGLENREFVASYQPQFDARTLDIVGVEALVRWHHPKRGVLAPAAFLAVASELNVVGAIDRVILENAVADIAAWRAGGIDIRKVSVNVSARRLNEDDLIENLRAMNIPPGLMSFELVESIFLDELDPVSERNIAQIGELGIDIEIDDFGTGHASIVSLLKLNPKRLKIDRQFIRPILDSPENSRLVGSIIEIGKSLGIEVVAEGVETMEQAQLLRKLECDIFQGYVFARPMPSDELAEFIKIRDLRAAS